MGNKLYVGNLAYGVRDDELQQAFAPYGSVTSAKVMMDRETGRSKGFGFVEMGSDAEAQAAINGMNGQALEGRAIVVNEARPREERPGGFAAAAAAAVAAVAGYGGGGGGYGGGGGGRSGGGGGYGGGGGGRSGGGGGYGGGGGGGKPRRLLSARHRAPREGAGETSGGAARPRRFSLWPRRRQAAGLRLPLFHRSFPGAALARPAGEQAIEQRGRAAPAAAWRQRPSATESRGSSLPAEIALEGLVGKGFGRHQERHRVAVAARQRRVDVARARS